MKRKVLRTKVWDFSTLKSPENFTIDLACWRYTLTIQPGGATNYVNGQTFKSFLEGPYPYIERVGGGPVRENDVEHRLEFTIENPTFNAVLIVESYEDAEG